MVAVVVLRRGKEEEVKMKNKNALLDAVNPIPPIGIAIVVL